MMNKRTELIVARDVQYGIGLEGKIPWRCKEDMAHFKRVTTSTSDPSKQNAVIMGRRTWESLRQPLEHRVNMCLSSTQQSTKTHATMEAAIEDANRNPLVETIFIIGGEAVYREALNTLKIDRIWMTIINREFPTDRSISFIRSYLKDYGTAAIVRETEEFIVWKYERSNDPNVPPPL